MIDYNKKPNEIMEAIKALPLDKRDVFIALWFAQKSVLEDMRQRPLPTAPKEIQDYNSQLKSVRENMNRNPGAYLEFWKNEKVMSYFDQLQRINNLNARNKTSLRWAKKVLSGNEDAKNRIESVLADYNDPEDLDQPSWQD